MANMQATKTPMPEQDPNVRNKNFKEVTLGYTAEMAINEAKRCLQCKKPHCVEGCPVNIHIPEFIHEVAEGNFEKAYEIITDTNSLPALSGRVCPQETQCESKCVRGNKGEPVAIGRLERFVADWYRENINAMPKKAESNGIKVAVVGSGPSGLTCASLLAKKGYAVSLFEALHTAGGVLVYGIPEFRLPKAIVANEVEKLKAQGVEVMTDMVIGKVLSIDELFEMGFKAVFIGSGAGLPMFMHIPGESLKGVCSANEYLTRINLMKAYLEESDTPINVKIKVENGAEKRLCHSTSKCGTISEPFAFCCLINWPSSEMFIVVTTSCIRPSSLSRRLMTVSSGCVFVKVSFSPSKCRTILFGALQRPVSVSNFTLAPSSDETIAPFS